MQQKVRSKSVVKSCRENSPTMERDLISVNTFASEEGTVAEVSIFGFKLLAMAFVIVVSLIGSLLPLRLHSLSENRRNQITLTTKYFSSGVFLGVALMHMLPESAEGLHAARADRLAGDKEFPLAYFVASLAFVFVWFVEKKGQLATWGGEKGRVLAAAAQAEKMGGGSLCYVKVSTVASYGPVTCIPVTISHDAPPHEDLINLNSPTSTTSTQQETSKHAELFIHTPGSFRDNVDDINLHLQCASCSEASKNASESAESAPLLGPTTISNNGAIRRKSCCGQDILRSATYPVPDHSHDFPRTSFQRPTEHSHDFPLTQRSADHSHEWGQLSDVEGGSQSDACEALHLHTHQSQHRHVVLPGRGTHVSLLLAALFSLHSLAVGAALGASQSLDGTISLIIALMAHKGAEAFSVGVQFVKEDVSVKKTVMVMLIYCAMTPLGIGVGVAATLVQGTAGLIVANLVQAFGAGTVLYIIMHQLEEHNSEDSKGNEGNGFVELFLFFIGLALMAAVSIFT